MASEFQPGVCWPNGPHTEEDLDLYEATDMRLVKLMWYHNEVQVEAIRARRPGTSFIVRLPNMLPPTPGIDYIQHMVDLYMPIIERMYPFTRIFQFANEPQYDWSTIEQGPWQFQFWAKLLVARLREEFDKRGMAVRLVSPPLSWSPGLWHKDPPETPLEQRKNPTEHILDDWREAFRALVDGVRSLYDYFDIIGCNSYWQDPPIPVPGRRLQMLDASFGLNSETVHEDACRSPLYAAHPKPIILLEAGNSWIDHNPRPQLEECYAAMTSQYPAYVRYLRTRPMILGICFFILGGTEQWTGFRLTLPTALALAHWPTS